MADDNQQKFEESHGYERKRQTKQRKMQQACRQKQIKETKSNLEEPGTLWGVVGNFMSTNCQTIEMTLHKFTTKGTTEKEKTTKEKELLEIIKGRPT